MQLTIFFMYIFFYVLTLWCFLVYLLIFTPVLSAPNQSFLRLLNYLKTYTTFSFGFFIIILCLSGLPPVNFFFLKLNLIAFIMLNTQNVFFIFLFLYFFLSMMFYLQFFKYRRADIQSLAKIDSNFYFHSATSKITQTTVNFNLFRLKSSDKRTVYNVLFILNWILFFSTFFIFFFTDFYFIFLNFFM